MDWRRGKRKKVDLLLRMNLRHQAPAEASVGVSASNKKAADSTHYFRPPPPSRTRTAAFPAPRTPAGCRKRQTAASCSGGPSTPLVTTASSRDGDSPPRPHRPKRRQARPLQTTTQWQQGAVLN